MNKINPIAAALAAMAVFSMSGCIVARDHDSGGYEDGGRGDRGDRDDRGNRGDRYGRHEDRHCDRDDNDEDCRR